MVSNSRHSEVLNIKPMFLLSRHAYELTDHKTQPANTAATNMSGARLMISRRASKSPKHASGIKIDTHSNSKLVSTFQSDW